VPRHSLQVKPIEAIKIIFLLFALLSDILGRTVELGNRPGRTFKATAAVLLICGSAYAHATSLEETWYRLPAYHVPSPDVTGYEFAPISFSEPLKQYKSYWDQRVRRVQLTADNNALRCAIQGGSDLSAGQYGGVKFPVRSPAALRLELTFLQPQNIQAAYVDGYDGRGYKPDQNRCVRWHWKAGPKTPLPKERATHVLVPGKPSGYFVPQGQTNYAEVAEIHVFVRIIPGRSAGFILHHAEVAR